MRAEVEGSEIAIVSIKGVPAERRDMVKAAIVAGTRNLSGNHEAWVVPARRLPAFVVRMIGPRGFYREVKFSGQESPSEMTERIRETTQPQMSAAAGGLM